MSEDVVRGASPEIKPKSRRRTRTLVYGSALVVAGVVFSVNAVHVRGLERELQAIADERIEEFRAEEPPELGESLRIGASVVASKAYLVAGDVSGKVSVFLQHGHEEAPGAIEGFEFFFVRDPDGSWRQTESGRCTSEHCTQEGLRVLRRLDDVQGGPA